MEGQKKALYLEKMNSAVFLRNEVKYNYFRLQAEMAIPGEAGFIGLVFGAKDHGNYELMYLAPVEIQYDPVINGSLTWSQLNIAARLFYVELQLCEAFVPLGAVLHAEASQTFT